MTTVKKNVICRQNIILFFVTFFVSFFFITGLFFGSSPKFDNDSHTYHYLATPDIEHARFFTAQRPPIFPILLYLIYQVPDHDSLFFVVNTTLFSSSMGIIVLICFQQTKSIVFSILGLVISLSNLQLVSYIQFVNPEIFLQFAVLLHILALAHALDKNRYLSIFLLVFSLFALTFTKPIFLLYPVVVSLFFIYKWVQQKISTKKLIGFFAFLLFLYFLPILMWSTFNLYRNFAFSFSLIGDINLGGKLLQYDMVNDGPEDEVYTSLNSALSKEGDYPDIYWRLSDIFSATPEGRESFSYVGEYSKKTIILHPITYSLMSLKEVPAVVSKVPQLDEQMKQNIGSTQLSRAELRILNFLYLIFWRYGYVFFVAIAFFGWVQSWKQHYEGSLIFMLLSLYLYFIFMITFTAYDSYSRLRMITDMSITISVTIVFSRLFDSFRARWQRKQLGK